MPGPDRDSIRRPKPKGPREEQFIYVLSREGERALAERALKAAARVHERFWAAPPEPAAAEAVGEAVAQEPRSAVGVALRARRSVRAKAARVNGRRFGTVNRRTRDQGDPVPDLRISGFWLQEAGFGFGQEYEVEVEAGTLTVRAV